MNNPYSLGTNDSEWLAANTSFWRIMSLSRRMYLCNMCICLTCDVVWYAFLTPGVVMHLCDSWCCYEFAFMCLESSRAKDLASFMLVLFHIMFRTNPNGEEAYSALENNHRLFVQWSKCCDLNIPEFGLYHPQDLFITLISNSTCRTI